MRQRMPKNYLRTLRERTGADRSTLWTVVTEERTGSRYWPAVKQLELHWRVAQVAHRNNEAAALAQLKETLAATPVPMFKEAPEGQTNE